MRELNCPHCKEEQEVTEAQETSFENAGEYNWECEDCGKYFNFMAVYVCTYTNLSELSYGYIHKERGGKL